MKVKVEEHKRGSAPRSADGRIESEIGRGIGSPIRLKDKGETRQICLHQPIRLEQMTEVTQIHPDK